MKILSIPFWNRTEKRLRLFWRLLIQSILMGLLLLLIQGSTSALLSIKSLSNQVPSYPVDFYWTSRLHGLATFLASGLAITASVFVSAHIIDKRRFKDLGLLLCPSWWSDFGAGIALGASLMLLIFLIELSLGWIKIQGEFVSSHGDLTFLGDLLIALLFYCAIGFYEELYSRGYLIKNLAEGLSGKFIPPRAAILIACLLTSIYFGLLHSANPNSTTLAIINIGLAGIFLSAGYLVTGQLGLSIGLHISWNFFQGTVFGFPVSGSTGITGSIIKITQLGPSLWTGGDFGPEGGLVGILAIILGLGIIIFFKGRESGIQVGLSQYDPKFTAPGQAPSSAILLGGQEIPIKHIIWDWNGTLLNDLELCLEIINNMLATRNLPGITRENYLEIFDFPVENYYLEIGFDFKKEPFESISNEFIKSYEKGRPKCNLMPGTQETLSHIDNLGISQSILSASKGSYLSKAIADYGIQAYFSAVQGLDNHHAAGKLDLAKRFLDSCSLASHDLLLIGDTTHDASIAAELGLNCVLIPNGHHDRKRLESTPFPLVNSLLSLKDLIR